MGTRIPIDQAVLVDAYMIIHGITVRDFTEVRTGVEHLVDLASRYHRELEAEELTFLYLRGFGAGDSQAVLDLFDEARRIGYDISLVVDPVEVSSNDRYDPTGELLSLSSGGRS